MEKKRRTFWLADTVTAQHRERALLLTQKGFDIQFFTSLEAVMNALMAKRAGVIVVSDDGDEAVTSRMLAQLMSMPEVQGARLILVRGGTSQSLNFLAACANFRDIIPFELGEAQWLTRFLFAAGNKPMRLPQPPAQITMSGIAAVALPARLTWVSARRLRLECRVRPPAGANLNLHGPLAEAAGVASITLTVVETQRSHLLYRFSDAVICDWTVPQAAAAKAEAALKALAAADPGPRCRIFVAAQSADVRAAVLQQFADPRFEVTTALSKQSITEEPKFFSPDVIVLESALAFETDGSRLRALIAGTDEQTTIVVLGADTQPALLAEIVQANPGRRILRMGKLPKSIGQSVLARYMKLSARRMASEEPDAHHVLADNALSLAEVSFPARLTKLHPSTAQLALPYMVGNFALCRVEAPALRRYVKRHPYGKLSSVYIDTHPDAAAFPHLVDVSLSDLSEPEQRLVARGLSEYVQQALGLVPSEAAVVPLKSAAGAEGAGARSDGEARAQGAGARSDREARAQGAGGSLRAQMAGGEARVQAADAEARAQAAGGGARAQAADAEARAQAAGGEGRAQTAAAEREARINAALARLDPTPPQLADLPSARRIDALASVVDLKPKDAEHVAAPMPQLLPFVDRIKQAAPAATRGRRNKTPFGVDGLVTIVKYVAFLAFAVGVIWAMTTLVAPHYTKDGSVYSEGLRKLQGQKP